jgi:hypothetical protein
LQTVATTFFNAPSLPPPAQSHPVPLGDGDTLVLHDSCPPQWTADQPRLLLVHGLCGSHRTSYMIRLAVRFYRRGIRVARLDMRGAGESFSLSEGFNHAGRSDDILAGVDRLLELSGDGPLWLIGVSLGGSQLLKLLGELTRVDAHSASLEGAAHRLRRCLRRAAAVAPPIDLRGCSGNMQRLQMRPYNRYFIRNLLTKIPPRLRRNAAFQALDLRTRPRTMWELDERVTAPLAGFASAEDYYLRSTAEPFAAQNQVPTLVLTAKNDPIVPVRGFSKVDWPRTTELEIVSGGGHVAFVGRGTNRHWMDQRLEHWFCQQQPTGQAAAARVQIRREPATSTAAGEPISPSAATGVPFA